MNLSAHNSSSRSIISWCFYDWATAAFSSVVTTFIFAAYFTQSVAKTRIEGTAGWGDAMAISGVIIALFSPMVGAVADHQGCRKLWIGFFTGLLMLASALLWFVKPSQSYSMLMLILVIIGTIGFEMGSVFYNAMLRDLSPESHIGRISGWAWGMGYAGGLICLLIVLFGFINPKTAIFHFNREAAEQIRLCGPFTAVWIGLFSLPLFLFTPDVPWTGIHVRQAIQLAFRALRNTLRDLPKHKTILLFLIARMLYIDGLNTLFAFGGIYASGTFGFTFAQVLQFGIIMNISAGIGAAIFAWIDDYCGAKKTIQISLIGLMIAGIGTLIVRSSLWFWILSILLGLFVGPAQAAGRSLMARLSPAPIMTEMFGLYALSGKVTAFINPWLVGLITIQFNSQRIGLSSIFLFLFGGLVLMGFVQEKAG